MSNNNKTTVDVETLRRIKLEAYDETMRDLLWQHKNKSFLLNQQKAVELAINRLQSRIEWVKSDRFLTEGNGSKHSGGSHKHHGNDRTKNFRVPSSFNDSADEYEFREREL